MRFYGDARKLVAAVGLPETDADVNASEGTQSFPDGGRWRIEVPTVNSAETAELLLTGALERGVLINRITETKGLFRHTDAAIRRYAELGQTYNAEILMSIGPRATYDIGAAARTAEGSRVGYRLRGAEQLIRSVEDVLRAVELGIRAVVVYDEGLLTTLNSLRSQGGLPGDLHIKVSAHCGHGNPAAVRLLESLGADSINPVRDLTLPMLAALRQATTVPLDVHVDNPPSSGGFIRTYDAPEFARLLSPVYLKTGNSALPGHGTTPTQQQVAGMLDQVTIVSEMMSRHYPEARQSQTCPTIIAGAV